MNRQLRNINPLYCLHKIGEVRSFGLGYQKLNKIQESPAIYSGYVSRGRSVYCPVEMTADGLVHRPRILYSSDFFNVTKEVFADSDHRREEDCDFVRDMQGLFLLNLIHQNVASGDTASTSDAVWPRSSAKTKRLRSSPGRRSSTSGFEKAFA